VGSSSARNRPLRRDISGTRIAASIGGLVAVSALMAAAAGAQAGASAATNPARCDKSPLGRLKTLSDPQRQLVTLRPRKATVRAINERSRPRRTPARRNTAFERHVWRVKAVILRDRLKRDGDIQMILVAGHSYLHAELPAPACIPRTARARAAMVATRHRFEQGCGVATRAWKEQGAVAYVSGVGFWDRPNQDPGHAKNYAELHPVTSIKFLAGCDAEPRGGG
jgi:hypothetical protein